MWVKWPVPDGLDPVAMAPASKSAADLVRFTATRSYTRLALEDQLKYLMQWGMLPAEVRSKTIAELMKEPYVLELSTANSSQTMKLAQSREYFAAPKADRKAMMDQVIEQEKAMVEAGEKVLKEAEKQGKKYEPKVGDQKLRKLLIENTPPEVRVEISAFVQAKAERMRERGMGKNG